jgi:hypothetical protein
VSAASSSEPPTSVGLACRPVGAWRRHLVKRIQSTGDSRHIAKQFRPRPRRRLPTCHYDDCGCEAAVPGLLVRHRLRPRRGGRGTRRGGGADPTRSINGLLRQYFPQGTDLSVHSAEYLAEVAAELNNRPPKTLRLRQPCPSPQPATLTTTTSHCCKRTLSPSRKSRYGISFRGDYMM